VSAHVVGPSSARRRARSALRAHAPSVGEPHLHTSQARRNSSRSLSQPSEWPHMAACVRVHTHAAGSARHGTATRPHTGQHSSVCTHLRARSCPGRGRAQRDPRCTAGDAPCLHASS
jgi:hypothetical protein